MSLKDEDLGIFIQLGLTTLQAKVYLTICKMKQATVRTCAKRMQVARAEIYRAVPGLEKIGLIKRVIATPTIFRAAPIAEGFSILLQQNAEKHRKIQAKANEFMKKFKKDSLKEPNKEEPRYILKFEAANSKREFKKVMNKLKMSLDCIICWPRFKYDIIRYKAIYEMVLERGVKFRYITYLPKDERIPEIFHTLKKTGSFEVKYTSTPPPTTFAVVDKEETGTITSPEDCSIEQTILCSNNPLLIALYQDYFELKWKSATTLTNTKNVNKNTKLVC